MLNVICKIASDLIKFPSTSSRARPRRACMDYIENFFKDAQVPYTIWEPGDVRSLVVKLGPGDEPVVCLNGHYDVVEGQASGFRPRREGDRLYGRGAADMKAALAAMMVLVRDLARRPDPPSLALMITGDEETGGERGVGHILKLGFKCRFAVVAEPTGLAVANQSKGVLGLELTARGAAAHSARPWEGDNAIFSFFRQFPAVWEIFGEPEPRAWRTTMVPSVLTAGDAMGRVPERCVCRLDIHYVPMDRPEDLVERIMKAAPELTVKVVEQGAVFYTDPADPYLVRLRQSAAEAMKRDPGLCRKHAATDARHFTEAGIPAAAFGPGGEHIHGSGEWVDLRQVAQFYKVMDKFIGDAALMSAGGGLRPSAPGPDGDALTI
ncbi:MAG TPA: M20/M25/M40 family metallo-hydrolase [bacterium]|nr:M20/M25/M40 family metallo-hydrolase [bacterium]